MSHHTYLQALISHSDLLPKDLPITQHVSDPLTVKRDNRQRDREDTGTPSRFQYEGIETGSSTVYIQL